MRNDFISPRKGFFKKEKNDFALSYFLPWFHWKSFFKALAPLAYKNGTADDFEAPLVYKQLHHRAVTTLDYLDKNEKFNEYLRFAIVRNPFERLYSAWGDKLRTGNFIEAMKVDLL